jgi:hypothetical protein
MSFMDGVWGLACVFTKLLPMIHAEISPSAVTGGDWEIHDRIKVANMSDPAPNKPPHGGLYLL